ncbi:MAG: hypothetical protein AAF962_18880 [Actinomycetota bacterium]
MPHLRPPDRDIAAYLYDLEYAAGHAKAPVATTVDRYILVHPWIDAALDGTASSRPPDEELAAYIFDLEYALATAGTACPTDLDLLDTVRPWAEHIHGAGHDLTTSPVPAAVPVEDG